MDNAIGKTRDGPDRRAGERRMTNDGRRRTAKAHVRGERRTANGERQTAKCPHSLRRGKGVSRVGTAEENVILRYFQSF